MKENNAICSICGTPYHVCISCKDQIKLSPWKMHTDTAEHYKIYQIIHGYSTKVYNKREAKAKLKNVDLSDLENLRDNIKDIIKDIMKEDVKEIELTNTEVVEDIISDVVKTVRQRKSSKNAEQITEEFATVTECE